MNTKDSTSQAAKNGGNDKKTSSKSTDQKSEKVGSKTAVKKSPAKK
ncbi:hypothetical protein [Flavobacterium piscis]|nr:hypothetical protein [Flavobacterium piscis]